MALLHPPVDLPAAAASEGDAPPQPAGAAAAEPLTETHGDSGLILVFTAAVLVITLAVVVVAAVGSMWILVPVMAFDFAVTAAVALLIGHLLADGA